MVHTFILFIIECVNLHIYGVQIVQIKIILIRACLAHRTHWFGCNSLIWALRPHAKSRLSIEYDEIQSQT